MIVLSDFIAGFLVGIMYGYTLLQITGDFISTMLEPIFQKFEELSETIDFEEMQEKLYKEQIQQDTYQQDDTKQELHFNERTTHIDDKNINDMFDYKDKRFFYN